MTQYFDALTLRLMDRDTLDRTRRECQAVAGKLRRRFWVLWLRNRLGGGLILVFLLLLLLGAVSLIIGEGQGSQASGWQWLAVVVVSWVLVWLFISHDKLNRFLGRWMEEEAVVREELQMELKLLRAIKGRLKAERHA